MTEHPDDIRLLAASWRRHLDAANLADRTIGTYMAATDQLTAYLETERQHSLRCTEIGREDIEAFVTWQRTTRSASTASNRYRALQQFWKWLLLEEEITTNPFDRMRPPKLEVREVHVVATDDLRKLFKVCEGTDFAARRDSALIALMLDTGARLAEVVGLKVTDVDLDHLGVAMVHGNGRPRPELAAQPHHHQSSGPLPTRQEKLAVGTPRLVLRRETGTAHRVGYHPDSASPMRPGWHRPNPPPPTTPHIRAHVPRRRWEAKPT